MCEVPVFGGHGEPGQPTQASRTVHGTKRQAQRVVAELTVKPPAASAGRTVADALDAWLEIRSPTWAASPVRDQTSRVSLVTAERIARTQFGRLTVADVDRWLARLRAQGVGDSSIRSQHVVLRAALSQAARWGWVSTNVAALATLGRRTVAPRSTMTPVEKRAVIEAAGRLDPAASVAFRVTAITGAR